MDDKVGWCALNHELSLSAMQRPTAYEDQLAQLREAWKQAKTAVDRDVIERRANLIKLAIEKRDKRPAGQADAIASGERP